MSCDTMAQLQHTFVFAFINSFIYSLQLFISTIGVPRGQPDEFLFFREFGILSHGKHRGPDGSAGRISNLKGVLTRSYRKIA